MEYKALKDIAKITMGQSPDSSSYNEEKNGLPFFQGNADFGELYPNVRVWCNEPKKVAESGDILISVRAPIGALNYAKDKCCIGRGLAAITIEDEAERNYVFHLLKARNNDLNLKGTGSTFKAIGKNVLEEVAVPQISRDEQQKCMDMMDLLESVIREKKSQIDKLDELIKARFVEMFGDPVENPKGYRVDPLQALIDAGD
ncbi:restriction endonuclease subunit S, partial [Pseudobutyrivibrio sp.]|uniref:restriction endonuclease subunit S n=1 Tax=Pseudobutyrivibrio sp. TaxID=2014367 RepID=UPI001B754451